MIIEEREIYEFLKKTSFVDVITLINNYNSKMKIENNIDTYYSAKDLYNLYPNVFSKYKLSKYIKEEKLPFINNGKERLFLKTDIDEWLKKKSDSFLYYKNIKW